MARKSLKESEKATTYLSNAFLEDEKLTKKLKTLIQETCLHLKVANGNMFSAAAAVKDATHVLICREREAALEEQQNKIIEMKKRLDSCKENDG